MVKHNHSRHVFHKYSHDEGTYTNEADYNPQWQKETISHQETNHPNEAQTPTDEFIVPVCSC
jgi:hypothetical protein